MRFAGVILMSLVLQSPVSARANDPGCKDNPGLVGRCYAIVGDFNLSADAAMVVWPDDSAHRPVKVRAAPGSTRDVPENLNRTMARAWSEHGPTAQVHGDFVLCPVPPADPADPDPLFACIETASGLTTVATVPSSGPSRSSGS